MKRIHILLALVLAAFLPAAATAQISQGTTYFGRIGAVDVQVTLNAAGTGCTFDYYQNGTDSGTGTLATNRTAGFSTSRGRIVSLTFSGASVSGSYNGQPFTAQAESDFGPFLGSSGSYTGVAVRLQNATTAITETVSFQIYPSGRASIWFNSIAIGDAPIIASYGVGTLAANGDVSLLLSSSGATHNGETIRFNFSPTLPEGGAVGFATTATSGGNFYLLLGILAKKSTVINVSTRGLVSPTQAMTAGFVVTGEKTVLIRAIGPTLGAFGVTNANTDPQLTLFQGQTVIARNDNWGDNSNAAAIVTATPQVGGFALVTGSRDAALLVKLSAGAYTASVTSTGAASGDALIEVYEVSK